MRYRYPQFTLAPLPAEYGKNSHSERSLRSEKFHFLRRCFTSCHTYGFGLCIAGVLLAGGAYLLADAIREPREASEASVLVAGLALAHGAFAILFLIWPRGHLAIAHRNELERLDNEWKNRVLTAYGESVQHRLGARSLLEEHRDDLPGPM